MVVGMFANESCITNFSRKRNIGALSVKVNVACLADDAFLELIVEGICASLIIQH